MLRLLRYLTWNHHLRVHCTPRNCSKKCGRETRRDSLPYSRFPMTRASQPEVSQRLIASRTSDNCNKWSYEIDSSHIMYRQYTPRAHEIRCNTTKIGFAHVAPVYMSWCPKGHQVTVNPPCYAVSDLGFYDSACR